MMRDDEFGRMVAATSPAWPLPRGEMTWNGLAWLDAVRRWQGDMLGALGFGPIETPCETVFRTDGVNLRRYAPAGTGGPVVLILPAPIKRPYIWDLAPTISAVQRCLAAGAQVYLLDWQQTRSDWGLADYAERLILDSMDAARLGPVMLLSHSLGGLFAAIFTALHPERVRGLGLLAAPLHYGAGSGAFARKLGELGTRSPLPDPVPGSFLSLASFQTAPDTFGWERSVDFVRSLSDIEALANHMRVERWTLDEFPLPRRLVAELAAWIVCENRFARGTLSLDGRLAAPARIVTPLLCVIDRRCQIVPPEAVLPCYRAAACSDKSLLYYDGDVGVSLQHVGMLVGRQAHRHLWPAITRWLRDHWYAQAGC